ncbi:hypothetical protein ACROYT_G035921 [Oculina patagonica]
MGKHKKEKKEKHKHKSRHESHKRRRTDSSSDEDGFVQSSKRKMTDFFSSHPKETPSSNPRHDAAISMNTISSPNAAPDCVFSLDAGSEFGVTLFLQPPLPPPNPPGSYPPRQIRRWWVDKDSATLITLNDALGEIKTLFESPNTYTLQYHDGFHLLPIVNDKDLQSCLRYFLANLSNGNICRIYLEEKLEKREERFEAQMQVKAGVASLTRQLQVGTTTNGNEKSTNRKNKMTDDERLNTFRARALAKHGEKAEIVNKTTAKCLYESC